MVDWFLSLDSFNKLFLIFVILFCLVWFIDIFGIEWYHNNHPRYRMNNDGFIEYYSLIYNNWRLLYVWNDSIDDRVLHIHDTIRGLEYDLKYKGKGRSTLYFTRENLEFFENIYHTVKEIDKNQNKLINKEDKYLKENILNK